jgi:hypothetical protein
MICGLFDRAKGAASFQPCCRRLDVPLPPFPAREVRLPVVEESRSGQHPPDAVQHQAQSIVRFIDLLNTNLTELLELIVRHARGRG